jgi:hypothetical protein
MEDLLFGLRSTGFVLAMAMGGLIVWKSRRWRDPALVWFFIGLSVGPLLILAWNCAYRYWLSSFIPPTVRLSFWPVAHMQFRYVYDIINKILDFGCILAIAIGISQLYRRVHQRIPLLPSSQATTNDPRN